MRSKIKRAKRIIKTRNTAIKRVEAESNTGRAFELARYGHVLSPLEKATEAFITCDPAFSELLSDRLLDSIRARDGGSLRTLANFVESFGKPPGTKSIDLARADILALKGVYEYTGQRITIARLRDLLGRKQTDDGDKALRRLAKGLGFPLRPGKRGRKKKGA